MKKNVIVLVLIFISINSYSQAIVEKPVTYEEWETLYDSGFTGDSPNKASFRYDKFKCEIKVDGKKLPKSQYIYAENGNGCKAIHFNMEGYKYYLTVLIDEKNKAKREQFHIKYECLISYKSPDKDETIYKRGIVMSRFSLSNLCRGILDGIALHDYQVASDFYKIMDIAIYTINQDITVQIENIKND